MIARALKIFAVVALALMPLAAEAQDAPQAPVYSEAQLDQMLAPVALYPDPLVAQILMAATYPLEVVEAQRWLQDPANAALRGDQLTGALQNEDWDPSVKSLVPFPQVIAMMDNNLQWTEQLGDAFLAQPAVTYAAAKAYVNTFTQILHSELQGTGVQVQALCTGRARTEFHRIQGIDPDSFPAGTVLCRGRG